MFEEDAFWRASAVGGADHHRRVTRTRPEVQLCNITYSSAAQQFNGVAQHFVNKKHQQRAVLGGSQDDGMRNTMARAARTSSRATQLLGNIGDMATLLGLQRKMNFASIEVLTTAIHIGSLSLKSGIDLTTSDLLARMTRGPAACRTSARGKK